MMPPDTGTNEAEVSGVMSESENEYDEADTHSKDDDEAMADSNISESVDANGEVKKKYDPKDPMRPRRKKARRACFACQRAHLTCGMPHSHTLSCSSHVFARVRTLNSRTCMFCYLSCNTLLLTLWQHL
jgi:hypothetical protein